MKGTVATRSLSCLIATWVSLHAPHADAQQVRYMDSSGNIHFVDRLSQVPPRYREQIVPPTPTPVLDRRGLEMKRRAERQAAQQKMQEEKRLKMEELRKQRQKAEQEEKERKRLQRQRFESSFPRQK